jgi:hypothetical protein
MAAGDFRFHPLTQRIDAATSERKPGATGRCIGSAPVHAAIQDNLH